MTKSSLLQATIQWLTSTVNINSAVLFGSSASRPHVSGLFTGPTSDLDLHLIASDAVALEQVDWKSALPDQEFCFRACRPATGSVRKITAIFSSAKIDMVVVPHGVMRVAAFCLRTGLHSRIGRVSSALNEMATCLHGGYRFLKGNEVWGGFYDRVSTLAGVRLNNAEVRDLAEAFVCDTVWIFEKLKDGECIAAQHALHSKLSDTNLRLWRELRLRKKLVLPSFGLGRRVEAIAPAGDRTLLSIDANLNAGQLQLAARNAFQHFRALMAELDSRWCIPTQMEIYLERLLHD